MVAIVAVDVVVMGCEWMRTFGVGWCGREQCVMLQILSVASVQGVLAA